MDTRTPSQQIEAHKETIATLLAQVSAKNKELYHLSQKTIEEFNTEIPALREERNRLRDEINKLDIIIAEKKVIHDAENVVMQNKYRDLESRLSAEYERKREEQKKVDQNVRFLISQYEERLDNIQLKEKSLESDKALLEIQRNGLNIETDNNRAEYNRLKQEASEALRKNNELLAITTKKDNSATLKISELDSKLKVLADKEAQADSILKRINEAKYILELANEKEEKNKNKEFELNETYIKIMAESRRISVRADNILEQEKLLKERENNIRLAESTITKGLI